MGKELLLGDLHTMLAFLNALLFLLTTLPLWAVVCVVVVWAALMWGIFLGFIKFLFGIFGLLNTVFKFIDTSLTFDQVLGRVVMNIINDVISMISNMWNWGTAVPEWVWSFARYDHPWWALTGSIVILLYIIPAWLNESS